MSAAELRLLQRRGAVALAGREARRVLGLWTQTILPPVVTALLFLAIFGGALGARIDRIEGVRYLAFILPGLIVMTSPPRRRRTRPPRCSRPRARASTLSSPRS